jgi:hypothetical protein
MRMHGWLTGLTLAIALIGSLTGCRTNTASTPSDATSADAAAPDNLSDNLPDNLSIADGESRPDLQADSIDGSSATLDSQSARSPFTADPSTNPPLPVPNLIPPTTSSAQLPQSEIGRTDPFATVIVPPTVSIRASTPASPPAIPAPAASTPIEAPVATAPLPLPVVQPAPIATSAFPPMTMPALPPRRLSETIEISGVVEVGGKTSVIVQVPNEQTSRYVHVGEYVSNGNVLVKRVEMGIEPVVILEEDGAEVTRYVGSGSALTGLL